MAGGSVTLNDLIQTETRDEITESHAALLAAQNLPVTAWQSGNAFRTLVETGDEKLATVGRYVALIAAGGYPSTAGGDWLTKLGEEFFDEPRKTAAKARHRVTVRDVGSVGPRTFAAGEFIALGTGGLRFSLVVGGLVPLNGSNAAFVVEAESTGPAYNVGVGAISAFAVDQPGWSITNPDLGDGTNSSLLVIGADIESDADYAARMPLKWDAQGRAGNAAAWTYHALKADDQVRKVLLLEHTPDNGDVTVYVGSTAGPVPSGTLTTVTDYLDENARPLGTNLYVNNATVLSVPVVATISVAASKRAEAEAAVAKALADYQAGLPFGAPVIRAKVFDALSKPGADTTLTADVVMTQPLTNVTPAVGQLPVFVPTLLWQEI